MYGVLSRTPLFESLVAFCEKLRCSFGGTICRCMGLWSTDTSVSLLLAPICTVDSIEKQYVREIQGQVSDSSLRWDLACSWESQHGDPCGSTTPPFSSPHWAMNAAIKTSPCTSVAPALERCSIGVLGPRKHKFFFVNPYVPN